MSYIAVASTIASGGMNPPEENKILPSYSIIDISANLVNDPSESFYVKIKPIHTSFPSFEKEVLTMSNINIDDSIKDGLWPLDALLSFNEWVSSHNGYSNAIVISNGTLPYILRYFNWYVGPVDRGMIDRSISLREYCDSIFELRGEEYSPYAIGHWLGVEINSIQSSKEQAELIAKIAHRINTFCVQPNYMKLFNEWFLSLPVDDYGV